MTTWLVLFAIVVRNVFFAPLLVIDREPIGRCELVFYSEPFDALMIPHCVDRGFEWSGYVVKVPR